MNQFRRSRKESNPASDGSDRLQHYEGREASGADLPHVAVSFGEVWDQEVGWERRKGRQRRMKSINWACTVCLLLLFCAGCSKPATNQAAQNTAAPANVRSSKALAKDSA